MRENCQILCESVVGGKALLTPLGEVDMDWWSVIPAPPAGYRGISRLRQKQKEIIHCHRQKHTL